MAGRPPRKLLHWPVVLPAFAGGFLTYSVVALGRIATTYSALDLDVAPEIIALLSAAFSLLPVCLTFQIGNRNGQGKSELVLVCGALSVVAACILQWLIPPSLPVLLGGTSLLGIGQTCCLTALQMIIFRSSTRAHRDALLGNFMLAVSLGQAVGPLFIGLPVERHSLFAIAALGALGLLAVAFRLARASRGRRRSQPAAAATLLEIGRTRGLVWVILIGSICVAAQDLVLTFLPVLGAERGISPATVGMLLSVQALAAMLSRGTFGRAVKRVGRMPLMLASAGLAGCALLGLMLPLPVAALALVVASYGFGVAIAITGSLALTIEIAPGAGRATALSLRLSSMRLTQFLIPFLASLLVAPLGVAGVFGVSGAVLLAATATHPRDLSRS